MTDFNLFESVNHSLSGLNDWQKTTYNGSFQGKALSDSNARYMFFSPLFLNTVSEVHFCDSENDVSEDPTVFQYQHVDVADNLYDFTHVIWCSDQSPF